MSTQRCYCGKSDYCIITYSISVSCGCVDAVCVWFDLYYYVSLSEDISIIKVDALDVPVRL